MKKVKCIKIKILPPKIGDGYCIENFEFTLTPNESMGENINVNIGIDTWYRPNESVSGEIHSMLFNRGFDILNIKDLIRAIECRSFYCDYLV